MSSFPDWVLQHKKKGTEIRFINNRYYLYQITSKWNPEKKRAVKITLACLGSITENGFIPSEKHELKSKSVFSVSSSIVHKEFGFSNFIDLYLSDIVANLKKAFPDSWQTLLVLAYGRFLYQCPLKKMEFRYQHSYLSEWYPGLTIDKNSLTNFIRQIGEQRDNIRKYFKSFWQQDISHNILFDVSNITSMSEKMEQYPKFGYSSSGSHDPQVNLMLIHSTALRMPLYYRVIPGNIREVTAFKLCLKEFNKSKDITIITDKGFYSHKNLKEIISLGTNFIIPLRRNDSLIDYSTIKDGFTKKDLDGHFIFENRVIWYYTISNEWGKVYVFMDDFLKANETSDYLLRAHKKEEVDLSPFHEKDYQFGTLALLTNKIKAEAHEIFEAYKSRNDIELMFDAFKNVLEADRTYMQNDIAMEAWMFINFIATQIYYIIYNNLKDKKLIDKLSPKELGEILSEIRKIKINDSWHLAEVPKKTLTLLNKLGYDSILSKSGS
ncbi:MAG TPA: transposase [Saprospiraceae bacterium]|nr:transposase [Saprospiraceae bacterium]